MKTKAISRRKFMKRGGALVVGFSLWQRMPSALAQSTAPENSGPQATSLDSWLAVNADESITVYTSKVDLGTGVITSLSQIVAEELDTPFDRIRMETGDTEQTIDQAATVGSQTIRRAGPQLRQAAAAAREALLKLAAARLNAPADKLVVTDGVVSVAGNPAQKVSYGQLVGGKRFNVTIEATGTGGDMKVAPQARAKNPKDYKIVGTSVRRVDLPPKFTGEFVYAQDMRVPGMLHGRVVRPPVVNSSPAGIDESSIKDIPGIVKVVREGSFVGVVATTEWSAIRAATALKVTWSTPTTKLPANAEELYVYLKNTKSARDSSASDQGKLDAAFANAHKTFEATYHWPFQLHGMIGPSCAVADVQGNKATIWSGSQGTFRTRQNVANLLGLPEKSVRVIYREGSGCYGRLSADDVPQDAAVMSRAVGKPVRVQWMRGDEHGWESKGPAQYLTVRAAVDAQGKVTGWEFMDRSFPWTANGNPLLAARQLGAKANGLGNSNGIGSGGEMYGFENQRVFSAMIPWEGEAPHPLRTSNLRAPGELARCFASETFLDDIASSLGVDPVQFRLRNMVMEKERAGAALLAAAKQAGWKERPSPAPRSSGSKAVGRGVALSNRGGTIVAAVAEVEVDRSNGQVAVKRVSVSHDCGLIVNPDGLTNQIQGNVIQSVSRSLLEEVQFDAAGVKNLDWASYPILKFEQIPEVNVVLLNQPTMPYFGGGEPSSVPIPGAIGNAIFDAVGVRLREVPFTPGRVLAALRGRNAGKV
jgi:CO/xanthine dehydrogenase Mo-binding subunit